LLSSPTCAAPRPRADRRSPHPPPRC
jgi:hypothetical protein